MSCAGIKELSPLHWLPFFCLVWDIMPDMMHIITGIWKRHFLHMLTGQRYPAQVKEKKKNTAAQNKALVEASRQCTKELGTWALDKVHTYTYFDCLSFPSTICIIRRHIYTSIDIMCAGSTHILNLST